MERLLAAARQQNPEATYASIAGDAPGCSTNLPTMPRSRALPAPRPAVSRKLVDAESPACRRRAGSTASSARRPMRNFCPAAADRRHRAPAVRRRPRAAPVAWPGRRQCARAGRRCDPLCLDAARAAPWRNGVRRHRRVPRRADPDRGRPCRPIMPRTGSATRCPNSACCGSPRSVPNRSPTSFRPRPRSRPIITPIARLYAGRETRVISQAVVPTKAAADAIVGAGTRRRKLCRRDRARRLQRRRHQRRTADSRPIHRARGAKVARAVFAAAASRRRPDPVRPRLARRA